jgi:hypothetical protein
MSMPSPSRIATAIALSGVLCGLPIAARAQMFKCRQPDGSTVFQQNPCPGSLKAPTSAPVQPTRTSSRNEPYYDPYTPENSRQRDAAIASLPRLPVAAPRPAPAPVDRTRTATSQENDRIRAENEKTRAENAVTRAENDRIRAENERNRAAYDKSVRCASARQASREPPAEYNERRIKEAQAAQRDCP